MKNKILCAIAASLNSKLSLPKIDNLEWQFIEQNADIEIHPDCYTILVLDKSTHQLYTESRFRSEKKFDAIAYYDNTTNHVVDIIAVCRAFDEILDRPGVISHQQIVCLMALSILIYNGESARAEGASYDLQIDGRYLKSGIKITESEIITIVPLDFIVAGAKESVNLPKNICGNFDLRVSMFCKGIILSNGPQVDPGYQGRLFCLLFNISLKEYIIEQNKGFEFATIQFHALSKATDKPYDGLYLRKPEINDYIAQYADESLADRVKGIPKIFGEIEKLSKENSFLTSKQEEIRKDIININLEISNLKGSSQKWYHNASLIITLLLPIAIAVVVGVFSLSQQREIGAIQKQLENPDLSKRQTEQMNSLIRDEKDKLEKKFSEDINALLIKNKKGK